VDQQEAILNAKLTHLDYADGNGRTGCVGVLHVALQVNIQELKDEIKLLFGVHNI
jgi:hypothetical protein